MSQRRARGLRISFLIFDHTAAERARRRYSKGPASASVVAIARTAAAAFLSFMSQRGAPSVVLAEGGREIRN